MLPKPLAHHTILIDVLMLRVGPRLVQSAFERGAGGAVLICISTHGTGPDLQGGGNDAIGTTRQAACR